MSNGHRGGRPMRGGRTYAADHPGLQWLRGCDPGREWLSRLGQLVNECSQEWGLVLGEAFEYAYASLALRATLSNGTPAVLKIQFPDRESEHEPDALRCWAGNGAIRLLEADRERRALLLERCDPGTPLSKVGADQALGVLAGLVDRLSVAAGAPFRTLSDEAARWREGLEYRWRRLARPFERRLLDAALGYLADLEGSQGDQVLIHQDLHEGNVLAAAREPWLAIDPKPLTGEKDFSIAPIVRGAELGHSRAHVVRRLDLLTTELGVDKERARGWTIGQTVAWAIDGDKALPGHLDVARWLLDDA